MKVLEAFAGIGAWRKALINMNINHESVGFIEKDKFAIQTYCHLYNDSTENNFNDITELNYNDLPDHDLFCYSPPCQSFSLAGKRKGLNETRGTLFFNAAKIIENKKPKYAIMENVKGLLSDNDGDTIRTMLNVLDNLDYNNYMKVLNAKDYGIPQNRERVFIVSIRKDVDNLSFEFSKKQELKLKLQDIIETEPVHKDNYLSEKMKSGLKELNGKKFINQNTQASQVHGKVANTLSAGSHGYCNGYIEVQSYPLRHLQRNQKNFPTDYSMCIDTGHTTGIKINEEIRKLTTKECFRLMGFTDNDHDKLESISNTQKYKMAGNSIVVQVIEAIYKQLFLSEDKSKKWLF